jgi:hypothetical protein
MNQSPFKAVYFNLDQLLAWAWARDAEKVNAGERWVTFPLSYPAIGRMPWREAEILVLHCLQRGDLTAWVGPKAIEVEWFSDASFYRLPEGVTLRRWGEGEEFPHRDGSSYIRRGRPDEIAPLFKATDALKVMPELPLLEPPVGTDETDVSVVPEIEREPYLESPETLDARAREAEYAAFRKHISAMIDEPDPEKRAQYHRLCMAANEMKQGGEGAISIDDFRRMKSDCEPLPTVPPPRKPSSAPACEYEEELRPEKWKENVEAYKAWIASHAEKTHPSINGDIAHMGAIRSQSRTCARPPAEPRPCRMEKARPQESPEF